VILSLTFTSGPLLALDGPVVSVWDFVVVWYTNAEAGVGGGDAVVSALVAIHANCPSDGLLTLFGGVVVFCLLLGSTLDFPASLFPDRCSVCPVTLTVVAREALPELACWRKVGVTIGSVESDMGCLTKDGDVPDSEVGAEVPPVAGCDPAFELRGSDTTGRLSVEVRSITVEDEAILGWMDCDLNVPRAGKGPGACCGGATDDATDLPAFVGLKEWIPAVDGCEGACPPGAGGVVELKE